MRIKEIILNDVRNFRETVSLTDLSENVNIILGKNGSGKSNILSAIKYVLSHNNRSSLEERKSFIYEGNNNSELKAKIEIKFENSDLRFPSEKEFIIKKEIDLKKEEYFLNNKSISKEELNAMFESAGLCLDNKYFIIPQGEINRLSVLTDEERYELIKDISGALNYEQDKSKFIDQLKETDEIKRKIEFLNEKMDQKIDSLKKEQRKLLIVEKIEEEKHLIERILLERELIQINEELKGFKQEIKEDLFIKNEQNELLNLRIQLKKLNEKKNEITEKLRKNTEEEVLEGFNPEDFKKIKEIELQEKKMLNNLNSELELLETEILAKEMENIFLKSHVNLPKNFTETEIKDLQTEILQTEEKVKNKKDEEQEPFDVNKYEKCITERKKLWVEESGQEKKLKRIKEEIKKVENNILAGYGISEQEIKSFPGVYGPIFELITIPDDLFIPVSSVLKNCLFYFVVEDDNVATDLFKKLNRRITCIPLNRIKVEEERIVNDERVISLWRQIITEDKFKKIIRYLTKDIYLVSDLNVGLSIKHKHNINVVTMDGELLFNNGVITGGYEDHRNIFLEYKDLQINLKNIETEKSKTIKKLNILNEAITILQKKKDELPENEPQNVFKAKLIFLKRKLIFFTNNFCEKDLNKNIKELENLKIKNNRLKIEKNNLETRILELGNKVKKIGERSERVENFKRIMEDKGRLIGIKKEIKELGEKEKLLMFKIIPEINRSSKNNNSVINNTNNKIVLMEKKNNLINKINLLNIPNNYKKSKYFSMTEKEISIEIRKLMEKKNNQKNINYKSNILLKEMETQQNNLKSKMIELENSRLEIEDFIKELDLRKQNVITLTFNNISENFNFFLGYLNPTLCLNLILENERIYLNHKNRFEKGNIFSGGQKTVIALALIFSIQRIYSSPFYLFDEIDASLDEQSRVRLTELIKNIKMNQAVQFFVTTFKKEMLECGDRYFKVEFSDKRSKVEQIEEVCAYDVVG